MAFPTPDPRRVTVIAGGVGAARFLRGLVEVVDPAAITAIVNVADDFPIHGLYVCPDLDTVRSTLVDDVGPQGWGRADETWTVMNELRLISRGAPDDSRATDWFSLGDRDLAIHLYRTQRMREGATLAEVTAELCMETGVRSRLVPVSSDPVSTRLTLSGGEDVDFQEYFVGRRHSVPVEAVRFDGIDDAKPADGVISAIETADVVVIAPSNPVVSIAPVIEVPGVRAALQARRHATVAVCPLVGGKAIKGPADRLLTELGHDASAPGVAAMWADIASTLVIDEADADVAEAVRAAGMSPLVTQSVMQDISGAERLARTTLDACTSK